MISFKEFITEDAKIGKDIGGELYVHKNYEHTLPDQEGLAAAKEKLNPDHRDKYNVVKHNKKAKTFAFIHSPDFDTADEPISGESHKVKPDGSVSITKQAANPWIWHHKHLWVGSDYKGFDTEKSKNRSKSWQKVTDKIKEKHPEEKVLSKIGKKDYWEKNIVPHIEKD